MEAHKKGGRGIRDNRKLSPNSFGKKNRRGDAFRWKKKKNSSMTKSRLGACERENNTWQGLPEMRRNLPEKES